MQLLIIPLVYLLDQWTKSKARTTLYGNSPYYLLNQKVSLSLVYNKGAFLGWLKAKPKWLHIFTLIGLAILFLVGLPLWLTSKRLAGAGLAFMFAGALGNYSDRLSKGQVTDFIAFAPNHKVHYNLADFAIFLGAALMVIDEILQ